MKDMNEGIKAAGRKIAQELRKLEAMTEINDIVKHKEELDNEIIITVNIRRNVITRQNYLGGWVDSEERAAIDYFSVNVRNKKAKINSSIESLDRLAELPSGHDMISKGAFARFGKGHLTEDTYKAVVAAIAKAEAQCVPSAEWHKLKTEEIKREERKAQVEQNKANAKRDYNNKKANGYCFKCNSYCYGDCEA